MKSLLIALFAVLVTGCGTLGKTNGTQTSSVTLRKVVIHGDFIVTGDQQSDDADQQGGNSLPLTIPKVPSVTP